MYTQICLRSFWINKGNFNNYICESTDTKNEGKQKKQQDKDKMKHCLVSDLYLINCETLLIFLLNNLVQNINHHFL